ncbi:MAG: Kdo hydroxylase family protein [Gammaproteobacteria bacterium]|nr:Kdo hydroxylase family protein [Gammaproteobacteria bacterium]
MLQTLNLLNWDEPVSQETQQFALTALESGEVMYLPELSFRLFPQEKVFLSHHYASPKTKNVSFDWNHSMLQGAVCTKTESIQLTQMLNRYATYTKQLLTNLFPLYQDEVEQGRTSFRPVEIMGRVSPSYRKDDTRLHVDAFPSTPTQGKRILRVFTNVNPAHPRVWRIGAPFNKVIEYFYPKLRAPVVGAATMLNALKITKQKRTPYDHYMLQLHNAMKADMEYQEQVPQTQQLFQPGSSWIVYTDQVSHAAMAGQFTFEQTFYVPPHALDEIEKSPCKILEKFLRKPLL